jgi:hypothetical protein
MIEIGLRDNGRPFKAAYAQHGDPEVRRWDAVAKADNSPYIYVADGSHASYYESGRNDRGPFQPADVHIGNGEIIGPKETDAARQLQLVDISKPAPPWVRWPGRWGASGDGSPRGPKFQDAWMHPSGFARFPEDASVIADERPEEDLP